MRIKNTFKNIDAITYTPEYKVDQCGLSEYPFFGFIEITYKPNKWLLEFMAFEEWLEQNTGIMTVEKLADNVSSFLYDLFKPEYIHVKVTATTEAHYPVVVEYRRYE